MNKNLEIFNPFQPPEVYQARVINRQLRHYSATLLGRVIMCRLSITIVVIMPVSPTPFIGFAGVGTRLGYG